MLDGARAGEGCHAPLLLHSKYEVMVTDFSGWAKTLLAALMSGSPASKVPAAADSYRHTLTLTLILA